MNFSPVGWLLEIVLIACFFIAFCFSVCLFVVTDDSSVIANQYKKNWSKYYIIDIQVSKSFCPSGYEEKVLGTWSGFNRRGCLCTSENSTYQKAFDERDDCEDFEEDTGFTCQRLPYQDPIDIKYYKGVKFCLLRADANFSDLFLVYQNLSSSKFANEHYSAYMNNADYMSFLSSSLDTSVNFIERNAIVDVKLINLTKFPLVSLKKQFDIDLSPENGYNKISIDGDYYLFFQRLGRASILDTNKIIVDIHLYNELWCSFLDISPPQNLYYTEFLNYGGFDSCGRMSYWNNSTMNDNLIRFGKINLDFDKSLTKLDFYKDNGITNYYEKNNITYNIIDNFPPSLVYEKYFYGIGCPVLESIESHEETMANGLTLRNISSAYSFFTFDVCVLSVFLIICRLCDNCARFPRCFRFNNFLIFLFTFISSLLIIAYAAVARYTIKYLKRFAENCQTDYSNPSLNYNNVKTSPNELMWYNNFYYPYQMSKFLLLVQLAALIYFFLYLTLHCCSRRPVQDVNNVQVYENKSKMPTNPQIEEVELGHASYTIDKSKKPDEMKFKF